MEYTDLYIKTYWMYYRTLEERFARTEDYVAFDVVNYRTYSVEYLTLLQTICSEVDVVGKAIISHFDPTFDTKDSGIKKWGFRVQELFPEITTQTVMFTKDVKIVPWENWRIEERLNKNGVPYFAYAEGCSSPEWWNAYNAVKHARTSIDDGRVNFHRANQKNVLDALAALFVLHRLMLAKMDEDAYTTIEKSQLFKLPDRYDETEVQLVLDSQGQTCVVYENGERKDGSESIEE